MRGHAPPGTPCLSVARDIDLAVAGPMARSAGDLSLALDVLAGPDDDQATAYRLALPAARHDRLGAHRVLVLDQHPLVPTAHDVREAMHRFVGQLERAGCRIGWKSAALPNLETCANVFTHVLMSFVGADLPAAEYRALVNMAAQLPASAQDSENAPLRGLVSSHRDWIAIDRARVGLMHQWRQLFKEWDLVVCPVLPTVAFHHDHSEMDTRVIDVDGQRVPYAAQGTWASLASAAGLPATAVPAGFSAAGLPVGVQVIGPYLEDRTAIGFAELIEREFGGFKAPPAFAVSV
jgi:amidase